jgi:membrane protease YdiL (CAAX protease family)
MTDTSPGTRNIPPNSSGKLSFLRGIFIGADGLRAGWGLLLFLLLTVVIGKVLDPVFVALHLLQPGLHRETSPLLAKQFIPSRLANFIDLAIATWIMSLIERRPLGVYGGGGPRKLGNVCFGLLCGVLCIAALAGTLWACGLLVIDGRLLHGTAVFEWGAIWMLGFLCLALAEEAGLRAYMQFTLSRGLAGILGAKLGAKHRVALGFWSAAAILACLFVSNHVDNPGESPVGFGNLFLFALLMCFSLWRTGSLWWAVGFHASVNWAQSWLLGLGDSGWMIEANLIAAHPQGNPLLSGGSTGAEGSLLFAPATALGAALLVWFAPKSLWPELHRRQR